MSTGTLVKLTPEREEEILKWLSDTTKKSFWMHENFYDAHVVADEKSDCIFRFDNDVVRILLFVKYDSLSKQWSGSVNCIVPFQDGALACMSDQKDLRQDNVLNTLENLLTMLDKSFAKYPALTKTVYWPIFKYYEAYRTWVMENYSSFATVAPKEVAKGVKKLAKVKPAVTAKVAVIEEESDEDFVKRSETAMKFIGPFGYNDSDVCVVGKIKVCAFENAKAWASGEVAQVENGNWGFAYRYGNRYTHTGAGGGCGGISIKAKGYPTQFDAEYECVDYLIDGCLESLKGAPAPAAKLIREVCNKLQDLRIEYFTREMEMEASATAKVVVIDQETDKEFLKKQDPTIAKKAMPAESDITTPNSVVPAGDEDEHDLSSLDKAVKYVGPYGYNEHDICVEGSITVCDFMNDKVFVSGEVAQIENGNWDFGSNHGSKFTHVGVGSGSGGIWYRAEGYPTQEDATLACITFLIDQMKYEIERAPTKAVKKFRDIKEQLESLLASPEATPQKKVAAQSVITTSKVDVLQASDEKDKGPIVREANSERFKDIPPVKFIGPFGYNDCGVCIEGYITICDIKIGKRDSYFGKVAQIENGKWDYGYSCDTGTSGCSGPISLKSKGFKSQKEASIDCLIFLMNRCGSYKHEFKDNKIVQASAKKAISMLKTLYNEIQGSDVKVNEATPKQKVTATKNTNSKKGLSALLGTNNGGLQDLLDKKESSEKLANIIPQVVTSIQDVQAQPIMPKIEVPAAVGKTIYESYPGGKNASGTPQFLINMIPPVDCIVSGFLGHCAVMKNIKPAKLMIGMDTDKTVIDRWNKERPDIKLINDNFLNQSKWINTVENGKTLVFLDPPYLLKSRSSQAKIYDFEFETPELHTQLLEKVLKFPTYTMICSYENELYDEILLKKGFRKVYHKVQTQAGRREECVYLNFEQPTELHDYSFFGGDYRERWNNKKMVNRIIAQLEDMPPIRRNMILDSVTQKFK
jgi:DNA adenine methylase